MNIAQLKIKEYLSRLPLIALIAELIIKDNPTDNHTDMIKTCNIIVKKSTKLRFMKIRSIEAALALLNISIETFNTTDYYAVARNMVCNSYSRCERYN